MKIREAGVALALIVLGSFAERVAWAADLDPEASVAEGIRLRREGKDQQALPLFQEAVKKSPTPRAYAQLGICEQALGLWTAAEIHITEALKQRQDPWIQKNEQALRQALTFIDKKLGSVEVWGSPAGARITVDGQQSATLPTSRPIRVVEGRRVVVVEEAGFVSDTRVVDVRPGTLAREHVTLVRQGNAAAPPAVLSPPPAPAEPVADSTGAPVVLMPQEERALVASEGELPTWRRVLPWSLAAGALAAASIGVWQHFAWRDSQARFDDNTACYAAHAMRGTDAACAGLYQELSDARLRAFVSYGVAAALGAGAAAAFIVNANTKTGAAPDRPRGLALGPGRAGLSYLFAF